MTHHLSTKEQRENQQIRQDVIDEFRYRQALSLTSFETTCKKLAESERRSVVGTIEYYADEMEHHGYYNSYHDSLKNFLMGQSYLPKGEKRHLYLSEDMAESVMMAYQLSIPSERERFKRHILAGVVEHRPGLYTLKPIERPYKSVRTKTLGDQIILNYQTAINEYSDFNLVYQLSRRTPAEKKEIGQILTKAAQGRDDKGIDLSVKELTDALVPYCFKEARPFIPRSAKPEYTIANYAAFYARRDKFFRMQQRVSSFAWVFLTEHPFHQQRIMKTLYPKIQKKEHRRLLKTMRDIGYDYY